MLMYLTGLIERHRFSHAGRLPVQYGLTAADYRCGAGIFNLGKDGKASGALSEGAD